MGRLREQMKGDLELRGLSRRTQEIYLNQVRDFSRHFNRSPLHLGEREIKEYLLYLIREKRASSEFMRRFLLHVLPARFVKIRYYGLLANRNSKSMLSQCCRLLAVNVKVRNKNVTETWQEFLLRVCGTNLIKCPFCQKGRMIRKEIVLPLRCNSPPWEEITW